MYYVYILQSEKDGGLYVGFTENLSERLRRHNSRRVISTKARVPFKIVYHEVFPVRSDALSREKFLKSYRGGLEKLKITGNMGK